MYIIKAFWAAGIALGSESPFASRRLNFWIEKLVVGGWVFTDSGERRNDWVGVSAKLGRRKYLLSLDIYK